MTGYFTAVLGNVKGEKLEVTVDGKRVYLYDWDKEISTKRSDGGKTPALPIKAGFHRIGVAFLATSDLPDTSIDKSFQRTMNSPGSIAGYTFYPHVGQVFIEGPFKGTPATDTQSRRAVFECYPKNAGEEAACAHKIITTLTTKAFRRPATDADIKVMTAFYRSGREQGGKFDSGIEAGDPAHPDRPGFHLPRRDRAGQGGGRHSLPHQRSRTGVASVVLPVEQHSRQGVDHARLGQQAA